MSNANTLDLTKAVKYNADRSVDIPATLERVQAAAEKFNVSRENDLTVIEAKVDAVFAQYPGATLSMDSLVGFVLRELNATPKTWAMLDKRVREYVASYKNSRFTIEVGKGVARIATPA
jgi:hypothetical protein